MLNDYFALVKGYSALSRLNFGVEVLQIHANFGTNAMSQPQFFVLTEH